MKSEVPCIGNMLQTAAAYGIKSALHTCHSAPAFVRDMIVL